MTEQFTLFSLFSGAGGLDLGFKLSGRFRIMFGNDIFEPSVKTFSNNFKAKIVTTNPKFSDFPAIFCGDVAELNFDFEGFQPDVISGGPPCQDFSVVRGPQVERGGISVSRGRLYSHFIRALIHLQPRVFVFENVPGLISANKGEAYKTIMNDFSNLEVRWPEIRRLIGNSALKKPKNYEVLFSGVVNASKLGVPQARRRLIIIGVRKDLLQSAWWKCKKIFKEVEYALTGCGTISSKFPMTPLEVFEGKPLSELQEKYEEIMREYDGVAEEVGSPRALEWKSNIWRKLSFDVVKDYLLVNNINLADNEEVNHAFEEHAEFLKEMGYYGVNVSSVKPSNGSNEVPSESKDVVERMRRIPPDENHEFVRGTKWEVEGKGMSLIYRRIHPLKPAYTVVAYGGGGTWGYHYERNRAVLTNRENARLQTFPDNFLFAGKRAQVRAQIGEAVPPLLAKRIGEIVAKVLEELT
ncbi:MAG: DNA cytosine methyltransferase [Candidatus Bathyarchaeia archaeon]